MSDNVALQNAGTAPSQSGIPAGTDFVVGTPAPGATGAAGAPATQAAPAAQPVALPAAAPAAQTPDPDTSNEFTYDPTGDAGLDYALNFVGKLGYGDSHPAILSARNGDFALLKVELATKGVPGADAVVALAEQAHARFAKEAQETEAQLNAFAAQAAGSADNWNLVRSWAAANATPQEKAQVNAALAQGGLVAQGVIGQLVSLYQAGNTLPKQAAPAAREGAGTQTSASSEILTAKVYAAKVQELYRTRGSTAADSQEYRDLQNQRLAAKRAGY